MFKLSAFAGYLTKSLGRIKQSPGINRSAMFTQVHLFLTVNRKVAEAGVILAGSSNQTNFSLLTSEAGVAPDQRLKLGQLAFQAELFPISIPFILHSIPGLPEAGRIVGSPVSAAAAVPYARPVKGVLAPSFHWDLCPAPSSRDDLNTEKKKMESTPFQGIWNSFLLPCWVPVLHLHCRLCPVMLNRFWLLSGPLSKGLKSPLQPGFRSYVRILHSTANVNYSFSL